MFNSGILDVVIGIVVLYLQLSLVCTAVNELIALILKTRAKELEKGIRGLLTNKGLADKFYEHPLIKALRPDERKPSYIPSRTFALTLMDIVRRHSFDGSVTAAEQAVADKTVALGAAEAALKAADTALTGANNVRTAADAAVTAAGAPDKVTATTAAQDAANRQAAAAAAKVDAQTKRDAATTAKTAAEDYLKKLKADVDKAKANEAAAQTAEAAAAQKPSDQTLKKAAAAARQKANDSANGIDPSTASLLTEARAKVATVPTNIVPAELKTALLALMDNAGTNLNQAQANLEQWFNDAMDRVSGVYKRKSHVTIVVIAVLVTILANADTLQVADSLSRDKSLRESLVAAAPELAKADKDLVDKERGITETRATPTPTPAATPPKTQASAPAGPSATPSTTPTPTQTPAPTPSLSTIKASLDELKKLGLPIGYIRVCTPVEEKAVDSCGNAVATLVIDTEATVKKADAKSQKADADLKTAQGNVKTNKDTSAAAALAKAEGDALAEQTKAHAELKAAQDALEKAKEQAAKIDKIQSDLKTAAAAAEANPQDEKKQQAAEDARRLAAALTDCPKCRKASELSTNELKQRLPTTHDYNLLSSDFPKAVWALILDGWDLLYTHWLGWTLTAFAISFGAPFWFDMLNKLMVVRSTVKPHEKSKEQESKDNPDEKDAPNKT